MSNVGKTVSVNCRYSKCEGRQSKVLRQFKLPMGGKTIHYRCLVCGQMFTITF